MKTIKLSGIGAIGCESAPIHLLRFGPLFDADTGRKLLDVTPEMLGEIVRVFNARKAEGQPVPIDWNHGSAHEAPPDVSGVLGKVEALEVRDDGLWGIPVYTGKGRSIVADHATPDGTSVLYTSPELALDDVHGRADGAVLGSYELLAVALTPRPRQDNIGAVMLSRLSEESSMALKRKCASRAIVITGIGPS